MLKMRIFYSKIIVLTVSYTILISCQQINLDRELTPSLYSVRRLLYNFTAGNTRMQDIYAYNRKNGKMQPILSKSTPFPCDLQNSPIRRSNIPPNSVNALRPGDIDIIAAIGDSITAANGAMSSGLLHLFNENRGISWAMGGRANWRKYLTLPNILREFNPNLYGYSINDGISVDPVSKFNIAEPITLYSDMLIQGKLLLKRLKSDKAVDINKHWKLLTIFVGNNDICAHICRTNKPYELIKIHEKYIIETLRFLRENIPNLIINWIPIPDLVNLYYFKGLPIPCYFAQRYECPCIYNSNITKKKLKIYSDIITQLQQRQFEIVNSAEFDTNTFTVNYQPFTINATFPMDKDGNTDLRYYASDCFHFSQLGQARAANAIWNNMLQRGHEKQSDWYPVFEKFECPTINRPFVATKNNSWNQKI